MKNQSIPLLCLLLLASLISSAQFQTPIPQQVKPLGPEAAALFKVLAKPIGTYTGTVPIQFPLMSLNSGPLKVDLSFSYTGTGGIRVDEQASCIGLGFSLNDGGGRITQVVNGLRDDTNGILIGTGTKPSTFNGTNMSHVYLASQNQIDMEPDIFMYNFNGQSGKFFFKEDGTPVMMQKTGIKIEHFWKSPMNQGIKRFVITDEAGNKYYFGWNQAQTISSTSSNSTTYTINRFGGNLTGNNSSGYTWYLLEVDDMNEENTIVYTYQNHNTTVDHQLSTAMRLNNIGGTGCDNFDIADYWISSSTFAQEKIVSRIDANDGYITITASTGRADGSGLKVDKIQMYTPNNVLKKRIDFSYSYFNNAASAINKRLKLLNFNDVSANLNSTITSFEYYEAPTYVDLPARNSNNTDHWGFYNGSWNYDYHPNVFFRAGSVIYQGGGAYRNPDFASSRANVLRKITYPTKGTREFDYEGNTAHIQFNPNEYYPASWNTTYRTGTFSSYDNNVTDPTPSQIGYFTINSGGGFAMFKFTASPTYWCSAVHAKIYKTATPNQPTLGDFVIDITSSATDHHQLDNGYYRIEILKTGSCTGLYPQSSWPELTISTTPFTSPHDPYNTLTEAIVPIGGVRIKEIRDYDPVTTKTSKTNYYYKLYSTDSAKSSGLLITQPKYVKAEGGMFCSFYRLYSSTRDPLMSESGSYVVYPEVRTREHGNGWTDRIYSFQGDYKDVLAFPEVPAVDNSRLRGRLLEERYFKEGGALIKKVTNEYISVNSLGTPPFQPAYRVRGFWFLWPEWYENPTPSGANATQGYSTFFSQTGYGFDLKKSTETLYSANGNFVTETENVYQYNSDKKMILNQIKVKANNGLTRITKARYSYNSVSDFAFGLTSLEQTMKTTLYNSNYLLPLEEASYIYNGSTETLLSGKKYIFGNFNGSKIHLATSRQYTSPTVYSDTYYTNYSSKGRLREMNKDGDITEAYLWGYNDCYPVAVVSGSSYSTVSGYVNSAILNAPTSSEHLKFELAKIRTGLASSVAQANTYTYEPLTGMRTSTDPQGRTTYYSYDDWNRLVLVQDFEKKILSRNCYTYDGQANTCNLYGNVQKSGAYTRNNCGGGSSGSSVTYIVPANTHYAHSQAIADQLAQDDVNANGQAYANANGTCTP